jgi:arylsulfatase A-like enzyme
MRPRSDDILSRLRGLPLAAFLACSFLLLTIAPAATGGIWGRLDDRVISSALAGPIWRTQLGFNIVSFALALVALHLCYALLLWLLGLVSAHAYPQLSSKRWLWILVWFLASSFWLVLANAEYFPHSEMGFLHRMAAAQPILGTTLFGAMSALLSLSIVATLGAALARSAQRRRIAVSCGGIAAVILAGALLPTKLAGQSRAAGGKPSVILLGIDSLRPDSVDAINTPALHKFLAGSVQLTDTITPLARTFPAWVSILSGRNPHTTGAWMNLLPRERIHAGETLPDLLRQHGYRSAYAIDETRFSNIDASYGFDQVVTPAMGASDFVIGTFADVPLANLVVNTRLGALLFPHLHTNRAATVLYEPDSFIHRLDRELQVGQPLFLAVHLTLPHWPYTWASSPDAPKTDKARASYLATLRRVDSQFAALLTLLKKHGVLDNALVVTLSDHGQALDKADNILSAYVPKGLPGGDALLSTGHGTSVLSPSQYRVVLGLRGFGPAQAMLPEAGVLDVPASLVDIAPTLMELLGVAPPAAGFDGLSLVPALHAGPAAMPELATRVRLTETEYSPRNFSLADIGGKGTAEAAKAYRVDPETDLVTVRVNWLDQMLANRQYAAMLGNRMLAAALPGLRKDGQHQLLLVPDPFRRREDTQAPDENIDAIEREHLREVLQQAFDIKVAKPTDP